MMNDHQNEPPKPEARRRIKPAHGGTLVPFVAGDPVAAAGRRKGAAANREAAALRRAKATEARELLAELVDATPPGGIGPTAVALAGKILTGLATGDIPIRNGTEAAAVLRVVYDIVRLEAGQPTSTSVVAHLSTREAVERLAELADQVERSRVQQPANESDAGTAE